MKSNHRLMRWRYIVAGLLGGLLGFAGQFLADTVDLRCLCWRPGVAEIFVRSDIPKLDPDGPPYYLCFGPNGRQLSSPYLTGRGSAPLVPSDPATWQPLLPNEPESKEFHVTASQKWHWQQLWCQLLLLNWLQGRGETVSHTTMLGALLGVLVVLAASTLRGTRKPEQRARVS